MLAGLCFFSLQRARSRRFAVPHAWARHWQPPCRRATFNSLARPPRRGCKGKPAETPTATRVALLVAVSHPPFRFLYRQAGGCDFSACSEFNGPAVDAWLGPAREKNTYGHGGSWPHASAEADGRTDQRLSFSGFRGTGIAAAGIAHVRHVEQKRNRLSPRVQDKPVPRTGREFGPICVSSKASGQAVEACTLTSACPI
jgi:hypothetical protein